MSLMGTLAKVALGVAVAKGVSGMMKGRSAQTPQQGGGGLGDLLGQLAGGGQASGQAGGQSGGLGGLLEQLGGAAGGRGGGGGLGDLLGNLAGGALGGAAAGSAAADGQTRSSGGSVFDQMLGNAPQTRDSGGSFGDLLNNSLQNGGEPEVAPSQDEEAMAALMLRAMIQAAKSDGVIDEGEKARLLENLEDVSPEEREFVQAELGAPIDVEGLVGQVPSGMEQQVYAMSVMGIKLDDQNEAKYLHELASALGVSQAQVNGIHDQMGAPRIYS